MQQWEYMIVRFSSYFKQWVADGGFGTLGEEDQLSEIINKLGSEGWEMVSANGTNNISCMAFKRQLPLKISQVVVLGDGCNDEAPTKPRRGRPPKEK